MSKKVFNEKVMVPEGTEMNDRDYLNMILSLLKDIEKNYVVFLSEASNESLFEEFKKVFDGVINLQREAYELSFKKGWYELSRAEDTSVKEKMTTLEEEFDNLSY